MRQISPLLRRFAAICLAVLAFASFLGAEEPMPPRRVVLVVWDGLRPDSINDETTPNLAKLSHEGVFFTRHHPVYPSMTEVNGTALATGCYPAHSGLIGNLEYRPAIEPLKSVAMEALSTIRKGDELTGGKYLHVPTLPELLQNAGTTTVVAGTKGVVTLFYRKAATTERANESVVVAEGKMLPEGVGGTVGALPPFPHEIHFPNVAQDEWTTTTLTLELWQPDAMPRFSVLWMSDPDYTQHQFGPDSPQAHRALASVDKDLGLVLERLESLKIRETTDVMVVSDHGFSTIGRQIDFAVKLNEAGFTAARTFPADPKAGDILVNGLNGTVFLYIARHEANTLRRAVAFLQASDFAGVIFTRDGLPGTFPLSVAHIDSPDAPDIVVAMRWNDGKNAFGFPGMIVSDGGRKPGQGTHATLSRFDMHNTLVAAGPDFRKGWRDESPSGNVDVAPTIAHLLGLDDRPKMDGRVLSEALVNSVNRSALPAPVTERLDATNAAWSQYLQVTHFGGVNYFDEGNGAAEAP